MENKKCPKCDSCVINAYFDGGTLICKNDHEFHCCDYEKKYVLGTVPECKYNCFWGEIKYNTLYNYSNVKPL